MTEQYHDLLGSPLVHSALEQAWADSRPGVTGGHEEGGFILQDPDGNLSVICWPTGVQNSINLPSHSNCQIGDKDIVASLPYPPPTPMRAISRNPARRISELSVRTRI